MHFIFLSCIRHVASENKLRQCNGPSFYFISVSNRKDKISRQIYFTHTTPILILKRHNMFHSYTFKGMIYIPVTSICAKINTLEV